MTVQDPQLFTDAFRAALTDAEFAALLKERDFSLQFVLTGDAGTAFLLDSDGVHDGAPRPASLRLEVRPEALHLVLLGRLGVTRAIVDRGLVAKGPVSGVRQLADLLPPLGPRLRPARAGSVGCLTRLRARAPHHLTFPPSSVTTESRLL